MLQVLGGLLRRFSGYRYDPKPALAATAAL
jgi:hypothetical protein